MFGVKKIAYATYETPDLAPQIGYYTDVLGLNLVAKEKHVAYLASTIDHHSVVLLKGGGEDARCVRLGFELGVDDDIDEFEKKAAAQGIKIVRQSDPGPSIADMVSFADPKGTVMEVFKRGEFSTRTFPDKGIVPHKLGHVAFFVKDVHATTQFYVDVLGFRVSDWMGDFFSFLRCGSDHHTINLMQAEHDRHFHTAFELRDEAHVFRAVDFLSLRGYKLIWGPGRHGIGHNLFTYHRSPNGLITELFAQIDQMNEALGYFEPRPWHRDRPQRPKVWLPSEDASNYWGAAAPAEMRK